MAYISPRLSISPGTKGVKRGIKEEVCGNIYNYR